MTWADQCLLHSHEKQMVGGDWDFCIRKIYGCSSLACFKTNTAAWCSSETELGYFHCLMVSLVPLGCSCSSSLSQWSIGCALAALTHKFILRLPHALMTTLWGFGAYDNVLRKRSQYPEKPTWWAGSLRRNQKNNMEQVRPLSYLALWCSCRILSVLCTNKSLWLALLAFWGSSYIRQLLI